MKKLKNIFKFMFLSIISITQVFSMEEDSTEVSMEEEDSFSTEEILIPNFTCLVNIDGTSLFFYENQESADALFYEVINKFKDKISTSIKNNPKLQESNTINIKNHFIVLWKELDLSLFQNLIRMRIDEKHLLSFEGVSFVLETVPKLEELDVLSPLFTDGGNILHTSFISFIARVNLKDLDLIYSDYTSKNRESILLNNDKISRGNIKFLTISYSQFNLSNKCNYNILAKCKNSSIVYTKHKNTQFKDNPKEYNKTQEIIYQDLLR